MLAHETQITVPPYALAHNVNTEETRARQGGSLAVLVSNRRAHV